MENGAWSMRATQNSALHGLSLPNPLTHQPTNSPTHEPYYTEPPPLRQSACGGAERREQGEAPGDRRLGAVREEAIGVARGAEVGALDVAHARRAEDCLVRRAEVEVRPPGLGRRGRPSSAFAATCRLASRRVITSGAA